MLSGEDAPFNQSSSFQADTGTFTGLVQSDQRTGTCWTFIDHLTVIIINISLTIIIIHYHTLTWYLEEIIWYDILQKRTMDICKLSSFHLRLIGELNKVKPSMLIL